MAEYYVAKKFNNINAISLLNEIESLNEAIIQHQNSIDDINNNIDEKFWKCSTKDVFKDKLTKFTNNYHKELLTKIKDYKHVLGLIETLQVYYKKADELVYKINEIESSNPDGVVDKFLANPMNKLAYENELAEAKRKIVDLEQQVERA